jgi:uncharacterized protein with von Willebrand factor type A (vWA) domain
MGRLKGSKNKPKIAISRQEKAIPLDNKDIKRQIRMLRKLNRDIKKHTPERREINEKIRALKEQLIPLHIEVTPEKSEIIQKILKKRPEYTILNIELEKYTMEQLIKHYEAILHKPTLI